MKLKRILMNTFTGIVGLTLILITSGCSSIGKKSPDQVVTEAIRKYDSDSLLKTVQSGTFTKPEIDEIVQKAISWGRCRLAYDVTLALQLDPNIKGDYKTLFQCLLLSKQYEPALSILKLGVSPEFIKSGKYIRNNALEEAAAWGAIDIVVELLESGMKPSSRAFYLGLSGHYHSNYETSIKLLELFKPYISTIDLDYVFVNRPLLYEVATERKYNTQQRRNLTKILLEYGADPDKGIRKTEYGSERNIDYIKTAYMEVKGTPELTLLLLAYGASPEYEQSHQQAKFLSNLKPGDSAQQGLIVEIRNSMALVQEMNGQRWIHLTKIKPTRDVEHGNT